MNNVQPQWAPYSGWCGSLPVRLQEQSKHETTHHTGRWQQQSNPPRANNRLTPLPETGQGKATATGATNNHARPTVKVVRQRRSASTHRHNAARLARLRRQSKTADKR